MIEDGENIIEFCDMPKMKAILQSMERKNLVASGKVTLEGKSLIDFLSKKETKHVKRKEKDDSFDRWWKEYPGTDTFEYKGKKFVGSRALRVKKEECRTKLKNILNEGDHTIDDLIGALHIEINQKAEASIKANENKMKYMQNSATYLNQRTYEPFVDLYKKGIRVKEDKPIKGAVDV